MPNRDLITYRKSGLLFWRSRDRILGILMANMGDYHKDFMHVSPKLGALRQAVQAQGYQEILANFIYQKPKKSVCGDTMTQRRQPDFAVLPRRSEYEISPSHLP